MGEAIDTRPFSTVLIANRGEIAVRVARTCREMGIGTVGIFSAADRTALHVLEVDEAYEIGPAPAAESYLDGERILRVARESGAEAVHPGYGFLAENPDFARAVREAGLVWIGPPAEVVALMGDKVAAKELALEVGVPVVPGYSGEDQDPERLALEAERIGYPVMIKAAAGGGGKGMRSVPAAGELAAALEGARREARSAFGDGRVFLEKLLVDPRHVEIQIVADARGNAVHLGERDCSIQRRHQKVIEEAPSPALTPELRRAMGEDALRLVRASGYVNAGTVEFLFSGDRYYFLEMNTRIQVEHPVTELVTGLDLVRLQLDIAAGRPLPLGQLDVRMEGHAIEARLYAEDPAHGFLPQTGRLGVFRPPQGAGIRNDVGVYEGAEISTHYDPMLAKLIVHGHDRDAAVSRLRQALEHYAALGVTTNLGFLRWLTDGEDFRTGRLDIGLVERSWRPGVPELPTEVLLAAAASELTADPAPRAVSPDSRSDPYNPWRYGGSWRVAGLTREMAYRYGGELRVVEAAQEADGTWRVAGDGWARHVSIYGGAGMVILHEGTRTLRFDVLRDDSAVLVGWQGQVYALEPASRLSAALPVGSAPVGDAGLAAPMPGTVVKVAVRPGQRVAEYEPLMVLEAMKMEHVIVAPHDAVVREVLYREGDMVPAGSPVVRLEAQ